MSTARDDFRSSEPRDLLSPERANRSRSGPPDDDQLTCGPGARELPANWDLVDEASWESFPASDPPAHWAGADREPARASVPSTNGPGSGAVGQDDANRSAEHTEVRRRPLSFLPHWARNDAIRAAPARLSETLRAWREKPRSASESEAPVAADPHARTSGRSRIYDVDEERRRAEHSIENGAVTAGYSLDRVRALELLNEALATEIVCVLRYRHHQIVATGIDSPQVAAEFAEHAEAEDRHAMAIAERIDQLGGNPDFNPVSLAARAATQYAKSSSLMEMIREDLVAERLVIEIYRRMIRWFGDDDPTTRRLLEEVLADEEEHANDLVSLLARIDPHELVNTTRGHV